MSFLNFSDSIFESTEMLTFEIHNQIQNLIYQNQFEH